MKYCWLNRVPAQAKRMKYHVEAMRGLTVRTEEAVLYQGATAVIATDVESLAVCVLIGIVTFYLSVTVKPSVRGSDEYLGKYFKC